MHAKSVAEVSLKRESLNFSCLTSIENDDILKVGHFKISEFKSEPMGQFHHHFMNSFSSVNLCCSFWRIA